MKISIITPTYNSEKYLAETLKSIHQQSYKNIEHIVVDGLSTDNTVNIARQFEAIRVISEKDNGQSNAINKGFKIVTGDIIAWQNADDVYFPGALETVAKFFQANPAVDVVYGDYALIDSKSQRISNIHPINWNTWLFKHGRFVPLQPTVFWRRKVHDKVGLLNEELHYCMDVDFFSRMVHEGFHFSKIPAIIGGFRVHNESKTQNKNNAAIVSNEHHRVLSANFKYNFFDSLMFNLFKVRAQLGRFLKVHLFKK